MGTNRSTWSEKLLIQQIAGDNDWSVVVLGPLGDILWREENVLDSFESKNLTLGHDGIIPDEISPQGWGVHDECKGKRDEPSQAF
jgi:hypothetical protein